eukprot:s6597_g2.t6
MSGFYIALHDCKRCWYRCLLEDLKHVSRFLAEYGWPKILTASRQRRWNLVCRGPMMPREATRRWASGRYVATNPVTRGAEVLEAERRAREVRALEVQESFATPWPLQWTQGHCVLRRVGKSGLSEHGLDRLAGDVRQQRRAPL